MNVGGNRYDKSSWTMVINILCNHSIWLLLDPNSIRLDWRKQI